MTATEINEIGIKLTKLNSQYIDMFFFYSSKNSDCIEGFIETFSAVLGDRRFVFLFS